ncbi:MAG: glyoxalase [Candidatus Muiribacterium halophilum]|uniref:Glyoxalase n=1 Tax=Muiribacterium halophilum TaxID=2053465 RepID=A0A2N5ZHB0_MUIH1|nr:MAG: glyoxalase [Candidatus Muirbacterium halophilum]
MKANGIIFKKTSDLILITDFYTKRLGFSVWLKQPGCTIFKKGNMLLGFCEREPAETDGMITLFFEKREQVDKVYQEFKDIAIEPPSFNETYKIYQFFAKDPESRMLEFQWFETTPEL